jgi:hypothetical protein
MGAATHTGVDYLFFAVGGTDYLDFQNFVVRR